MYDPMKPHCLDCPYKPPLEREKVVKVAEPSDWEEFWAVNPELKGRWDAGPKG